MTDEFANWRRRLAGDKTILTHAETSDDVDSGYYRKRNKDKATGNVTFQAVAFYRNSRGMLRGKIVGRDGELNPAACLELWTWVSASPITEETFRAVEAGKGWPDVDKTVAEQTKPGAHVSAEDVDAFAAADPAKRAETEIIQQITEARAGVARYLKIEGDEAMVLSQSLRSQITTLAGKLDKERERQVRPHIDAQAEVNGRLNPVIRDAKADAAKINAAQVAWENTKREQARLAQEAEAKRLREHEEAVRKADAANKLAPPPPPPPPVTNTPPPSTQIKPSSGRAASIREAFDAVITDQDAFYKSVRTNPDLLALFQKLAQKAVDAGLRPEGVEAKPTVKIRS